jgi:hypothetical protein
MTTPKIPTVKENDSRLYLWDGGKYPGVTSVVGMLPKPALQYWAAKKVAEAAIEKEHCTERDMNWLKAAPRRDLNKAATMGTNVHETLDRIITEGLTDIPPDEEDFIRGFDQFRDRFNPQWVVTEQTVFGECDGNGYAGSFDAIVRIDDEWGVSTDPDENWLIDFKTTRSGVHPEVAIQLAAYANAKEIIHPDGSSEPMPRIDRCGVLWLRPDEWAFVEINASQSPDDPFFGTFGALLKAWHWDNSVKSSAIGVPLASGNAQRYLF